LIIQPFFFMNVRVYKPAGKDSRAKALESSTFDRDIERESVMNDAEQQIRSLKMVTFSFEAGTTKNDMNLTAGPQSYDLAVGIGTEGFTPFEYALLDKKAGDMIQLEVRTQAIAETFGHIDIPLPQSAMALDSFLLNITVDRIKDMDQTEVVRAMAGAVKGCGGDCCGHP
jgi:hypothetical protein